MNSRDQPQQNTLPLTEKEYYAIRELFGFMTAVAKHIGMLERRAKLKPGLWEELNEIEEKTQQAIQSLLVTIPIDKLRLIQKELPNIRVYAELETRKVYRKKGDEYSYVPFWALETILQDTIDWNCFACEKAGKELADCKIRKGRGDIPVRASGWKPELLQVQRTAHGGKQQMRRTDTCPSCGTRLRWEPPEYDLGFGGCAIWRCPRCKYKRPEGSGMNPYPWRKRQKKRKSWR